MKNIFVFLLWNSEKINLHSEADYFVAERGAKKEYSLRYTGLFLYTTEITNIHCQMHWHIMAPTVSHQYISTRQTPTIPSILSMIMKQLLIIAKII